MGAPSLFLAFPCMLSTGDCWVSPTSLRSCAGTPPKAHTQPQTPLVPCTLQVQEGLLDSPEQVGPTSACPGHLPRFVSLYPWQFFS